MADLATIIDELRAALEENTERARAAVADNDRIRAALEALGAPEPPVEYRPVVKVVQAPPAAKEMLDDLGPGEIEPPEPATRIDKIKASVAARAAQRTNCPDCGLEVSVNGLGPHRRKHKPAEPAPDAKPAGIKTGDKVLECGECDYVVPIGKVGDLNRHCLSAHRRTATPTERTPVVAA
jgi:hypothetical protein